MLIDVFLINVFFEQERYIMATRLKDKRIAILVDNGFEQVELTEPRKALQDAGAKTVLISPTEGKVRTTSSV